MCLLTLVLLHNVLWQIGHEFPAIFGNFLFFKLWFLSTVGTSLAVACSSDETVASVMSAWGYEPGVLILVTFFMTIAVLGMDLLETGWIKLDVGDGSSIVDEFWHFLNILKVTSTTKICLYYNLA
jgi:hypothetical protein